MGQITVDAGQSGIRVRVRRGARADVIRDYSGVRAHFDVLSQVGYVVSDALVDSDADADEIWVVSAGVTGLTPAHGGAAALLSSLPGSVATAFVAHDSTTSFLGAFPQSPGVVLAVGTGVVVTACGPAGTARVDGWGHLLGDAGSGFWIGARGLAVALEAVDGRSPSTELTAAAIDRFGPADVLPSRIYEDPDRVKAIAAFCVDVIACAENGDGAAHAVVAEGAKELARSARAGLGAVELTGADAIVSWSGNLLGGSAYMRSLLRAELEHDTEPVALVPPTGTPQDGAGALMALRPTHPLYPAVSRADRNGK